VAFGWLRGLDLNQRRIFNELGNTDGPTTRRCSHVQLLPTGSTDWRWQYRSWLESLTDGSAAVHLTSPDGNAGDASYLAESVSVFGDFSVVGSDDTAPIELLGSHARCSNRSGGSTNNSNSRVLTG
jgi:hypothetical protein